MARFAVGLVFGVVVGVVAGAAAGLHAADEASAADDETAVAAGVLSTSADASPSVDGSSTAAAAEPAWVLPLAQCESTGNWGANTGNGYYGGLQQDLVFWRRYGGLAYAARPDLASRAAQIAVAQHGLSVQGWSAWPACSRRLGLR